MPISNDAIFRAITSGNINDVTTYHPESESSTFNYLTLGIRSFYKKSHANHKKNEYSRLTQLIIEQFSHDEAVKKINVTLKNKALTLSETDAGYVEITIGNEKEILDMTLRKLVTRMKVDQVVHADSYDIPENERQRLASIDLTGANLNAMDLSGANLSGLDLTLATLTGTKLTGVTLTGTILIRANLSGLDLSGKDLTGTNLTGANLAEANLTGAKLTGATLTDTILTGAILVVANLSGQDLSGKDLTGANLRGAILTGAKLAGATLAGANLRGTILAGIDLTAVNLSGLDLTGVNLAGANLSGLDLTGTILTGANLAGANLSGANLSGLDLTGTILTGADLTGANLSGLDFTRYPQLRAAALDTLLKRAMPDLTRLGSYACTDAPTFTSNHNPDYANIMDKYDLFHRMPYRIEADQNANRKVVQVEFMAQLGGRSISSRDVKTVADYVDVALAGCCSTLAFAAAYALMKHNEHGQRIEIVTHVENHNRTHYFVIAGRAPGSDIARPETWGIHTRIVDAWSMTLGGELLGDKNNVPTNMWPPNKSLFESVISSATPLKPPGTLGDISDDGHWQSHDADLEKFTGEIKEKLKTPDTHEDADQSRWVVQLNGDDTTFDAARALFKKHPRRSELIPGANNVSGGMDRSLKWDDQRQVLVWGEIPPPKGRLKILLVGHGTYSSEEGITTFGGRSPNALKNEVSKLLSGIQPGSTPQIDITLVGCRLGADTSPESLPQQLADMLLQRGRELLINTDNMRLSAFQYYIRVMPDGTKEMYIPGEGWITRKEAIAANEQYKFVWRYDSTTERMACEINTGKLMEQVDRLFNRKVLFHELPPADQQLVLRVLKPEEINVLCQQNEDGRVLHEAMQAMTAKFANSAQGIIDGKKALHHILDTDAAAFEELAQKVGLSDDITADKQAGAQVLGAMQQSVGAEGTTVPADSYTQRLLGRRARLIHKVQSFLGYTSNTILGLGAVAAICRLNVINYRLNNEKLSTEEKAKLRSEAALTIAELGVDFSDEINSFIYGRVSGQTIHNPGGQVNTPALSPQSVRLTLGTRIAGGLRSFNAASALKGVGTLLSVVGTGLAWYGVHTAAQELKELRAMPGADTHPELKNRITQLRVNLGVNIATAIISSLLTGAAAVNLVASIGAAFSVAVMASVAKITAIFLSVAGPIGGAILVGAFVGLWIYNGIKTVEEFSRHMALSGWDEFQLGVGSIIGYVPEYLQQEYDLNKLKAALKKVVQLEITGVFLNHPEVTTIHHPLLPEIVYNNIPDQEGIDSRLYLLSPGAALLTELALLIFRKPLTPKATGYRALDINMDEQKYLALSSFRDSLEESARKIDPSEFIHVRKTRYQIEKILASSEARGSLVKTGLVEEGQTGMKGKIASGTRLYAPVGQWLQEGARDNLRVQLSDNEVILLKGRAGISGLPVPANIQLNSGTFVNEAGYLTLFCTDPQTREISFFKFRKENDGSYQLDISFSQPWPVQIPKTDNGKKSDVFFHDLDDDGLADLVVVNEDGSLQVARQKRDGHFVITEEFSLYRAKAENGNLENLSFSGHNILGFNGTQRTLYSADSEGVSYAYTVVSTVERDSKVTWVNLNIEASLPEDKERVDRFVASAKSDAGHFIFRLGGGRRKIVTGGMNNDSFFLLDRKTYCTLNGNGGSNTLNFSQFDMKESGWGVTVGNNRVSHNHHVFASFSNIGNVVGTSGRDDIQGDDNDNIIDGLSGTDIINGGKGNDFIKGINGIFIGGLGTDRYELRRDPASGVTPVSLFEDYSLGEDSYVNLDYSLDEIAYMVPYVSEEKTHLRIGLKTGRQYILHNFYSNEYTRDGQKSAWHITTRDGFRFRLETAAALPDDMASTGGPVSSIPVFFQGTLTEEERSQAKVNLYAGDEITEARIEIVEKVSGQENVRREIRLPALFKLALRQGTTQGTITGSRRSEHLTGSAGVTLRGNGGADTYVIEDSAGGIVRIDNYDDAPVPLQDTLILPWALSQTRVSVDGGEVFLKHSDQPDSHVKVCLADFITRVQSRHLNVRGSFGQSYRLDITGSTAYLASGSLTLDKEDSLEVLSASQGGLTLDGRRRDLSGDDTKFTVIVDYSGTGNDLYGTENSGNYLRVSGGDNRLYGGSLADALHGGTGHDHMEGKEGNDAYYVKGSATILDTGGEDTLILEAVTGKAQEELLLDRTENNLRIRLRNDSSRCITLQGYYDKSDQKIEYLVMNEEKLRLDNLVSAMTAMETGSGSPAVKSSTLLPGAAGGLVPLVPVA